MKSEEKSNSRTKAKRVCVRCKKTTPEWPAKICDECRASDERSPARRLKPCQNCGGPKPSGHGKRLCDRCYEESFKARRARRGKTVPCRKCGGTENKQRGKQYCDDCKELIEWEKRQKRSARAPRRRKPCSRCGGPKPAGHRIRLCEKCRAKDAAPRACVVCSEAKVTEKFAKACDDCKRASKEREKARQRDYAARVRADPEKYAKVKAQRNRSKKRKSERVKESARMRYRIKAMKEGREVAPAKVRITNKVVSADPLLPYLNIAVRKAALDTDIDTTRNGSIKFPGASKLAHQIGVSEKLISEVLQEKRKVIRIDVADQIATYLGVPFVTLYEDVEAVKRGKERNAA